MGMKTVQEMLRHSSYKVTADTYASVLPEIATAAAEKPPRSSPAESHLWPRTA
ncbi:hypothetical protein GCM10010123_46360 [Pilimelia anulata]|uniref:Tyr recombinase domain-containing protein n=1 Tax=Pilimelia anulata TaxID=53371 RepID=A0A8J3FDR5_9ACTN|nr:hypothetical protein GCM10010123_46360 [Pilimelia anulata]